jgi:hypothetical protein
MEKRLMLKGLTMAAKKEKDILHWNLAIELAGGLPAFIDRFKEDLIKTGALQNLLGNVDIEAILAALSPEQRKEALQKLKSDLK